MMTNTSATLFINTLNVEGYSEYRKIYLEAVHWENATITKISKKGTEYKLDAVSIYVPFLCIVTDVDGRRLSFLKTKQYLNKQGEGAFFTFKEGFRIAKGIVQEDFDNMKDLEKVYDDVFVISDIITNDFGSRDMQHFELIAH